MQGPPDAPKSGTKWQVLETISATLLIPDGHLRLVGKSQTYAPRNLRLLSRLSPHLAVEAIQTAGARDGSGNLQHFRPSTTFSTTPSLLAAL